jgi:hypothetical protein
MLVAEILKDKGDAVYSLSAPIWRSAKRAVSWTGWASGP